MPAMKLSSRLKQIEKRLREVVEDRESIPRLVTDEEAEELRAQGKFVTIINLPAGGPWDEPWAADLPLTI